jgi:hypothetical protein
MVGTRYRAAALYSATALSGYIYSPAFFLQEYLLRCLAGEEWLSAYSALLEKNLIKKKNSK